MTSIVKKLFTWLILPALIVLLTYLLVQGIMQPVKFNEQKAFRESIAVQRLKDIRDLQVAYKNVNGKYVSTIDSLKNFYNNGKIKVVMQVGSKDDSLAMVNTKKITARLRLKGEKLNQKLHELYLAGEQNLVFSITTEIPVKDTIFRARPDFNVDELAIIPFSAGDSVIMESTIKTVSGVKVPLFEASMPFKSLLKGLEPEQLRINLDAEREDQGKYKGLQVGSISAPNNNAGNWE